MNHDGLMMEFRGEEDTRQAADTLDELGYEPQMHGGNRLHIHVRSEDLTSALEIMQCYGGQLVDRAPAEVTSILDDAYRMDTIPIPAHTVNEDWEERYAEDEPPIAANTGAEAFPANDAPYDRFDAK
ncbi:hypothetical protein E5161_10635 [Cohnella pontilimi]|uniref:DNA/RNA helicase n=1 Tax=Cohnella pontilimi TaxID=2564100 RepID=A0A4U0FCI6_9BACL|nr:hypothetical protein [Cohnella pontilimi]TJY42437.1 hypothetical protein E5161_10635 [Cohnella pontilimi]